MSIDELLESLRGQGIFSLDQAHYAIFEANGKLSVLKNEEIKSEELPMLVVSNGKIIKESLETLKISEKFINNILSENNVKMKNVTIMTIDGQGKVYLQEGSKPFKTLKVDIGENTKW